MGNAHWASCAKIFDATLCIYVSLPQKNNYPNINWRCSGPHEEEEGEEHGEDQIWGALQERQEQVNILAVWISVFLLVMRTLNCKDLRTWNHPGFLTTFLKIFDFSLHKRPPLNTYFQVVLPEAEVLSTWPSVITVWTCVLKWKGTLNLGPDPKAQPPRAHMFQSSGVRPQNDQGNQLLWKAAQQDAHNLQEMWNGMHLHSNLKISKFNVFPN